MKATFNNQVIAESEKTITVEGNHYFPPESVSMEFLTDTDLTTVCHWKGTANYYSITVGDKTADNAAWYYPEPSNQALRIKDHIAFYPNLVDITE